MTTRTHRFEKHIVTIATQALLVLALWFIVCGITKVPRLTTIGDFY